MSTESPHFPKATVQHLSLRASHLCSNPQCRRVTSGPKDEAEGSVNIGEAAHISGASPNSKRFDSDLRDFERSSISNGIWLCATCHKMVDDDAEYYTVKMLYKWKREHEESIKQQLGYQSGEEETRKQIAELMVNHSDAALQIALDKPQNWEWLLLIQMWREETEWARSEYDKLDRDLWFTNIYTVEPQETPSWIQRKIRDFEQILKYMSAVVNSEIYKGLGPPGKPGSVVESVKAIEHLHVVFQAVLDWDKDSMSARFHEKIDDHRKAYCDTTPFILDRLSFLPDEAERRVELYMQGDTDDSLIHMTLDLPKTIYDALQELPSQVEYLVRTGQFEEG